MSGLFKKFRDINWKKIIFIYIIKLLLLASFSLTLRYLILYNTNLDCFNIQENPWWISLSFGWSIRFFSELLKEIIFNNIDIYVYDYGEENIKFNNGIKSINSNDKVNNHTMAMMNNNHRGGDILYSEPNNNPYGDYTLNSDNPEHYPKGFLLEEINRTEFIQGKTEKMLLTRSFSKKLLFKDEELFPGQNGNACKATVFETVKDGADNKSLVRVEGFHIIPLHNKPSGITRGDICVGLNAKNKFIPLKANRSTILKLNNLLLERRARILRIDPNLGNRNR